MKIFITDLIKLFNSSNIKYEVHTFDSGALMIDFWVNDDFYCVKIYNEEFGISRITDETLLFDIIPDFKFNSFDL